MMNPHLVYQRQQDLGWTRADMLLALYEGAIHRCEYALKAAQAGQMAQAERTLTQARLIVLGLSSGVSPSQPEMSANLQRLFEFVLYSLHSVRVDRIEGAVRVLRTLRDGFDEVRSEAVRLERMGEIPSFARVAGLTATA
jgi:flagellin-specific chaperone FliS